MQRDLHAAKVHDLAVLDRVDHGVGGQPRSQNMLAAIDSDVFARPGSCMVGMSMRDNRPRDRFAGVDEEFTSLAKQSGRGELQ